MTSYGNDPFTRSNVASPSWGTSVEGKSWTRPFGSATSYSVNANKGIIANTPGTWDHFAYGSTFTISTTLDVLVRITVDSTSSNWGVLLRVSSAGTTSYKAMYEGGSGFKLYYDASGLTQIGTTSSFTPVVGNSYWVRGQINGSTLMGKIWADGSGEPGTWTISASVGTHTIASGGIGVVGAANSNLKFDNFSATDGTSVVNTTVTYINTVASTESVNAAISTLPGGTTAIVESVLARQSASMSNLTASIESVSAGTFQQVVNNNTTATAEALSVAQKAILTGLTASNEFVFIAQRFLISNTTAIAESTIGVSAPAFSSTDPNAQMLYDDLQIQYSRLKGDTVVSGKIAQIAIVYYPPAQVLSEHAIPGEIDVMLTSTGVWSQLRTINTVTAFIVANT